MLVKSLRWVGVAGAVLAVAACGYDQSKTDGDLCTPSQLGYCEGTAATNCISPADGGSATDGGASTYRWKQTDCAEGCFVNAGLAACAGPAADAGDGG